MHLAAFTGSNTSDSLRCIRSRLQRSRGATPRGLTDPGKVKALRREGPKRGAKELFRIIETADNLVNTETVRKYPGLSVDKVAPRRKTRRKNFVPLGARENQTAATPNASNARMALTSQTLVWH